MGELGGRVAIVTGAGGAIGGAIARRLAASGAHVMMADENEKALAAGLQALKAEDGHSAKFHIRAHDKLGAANLLAATIDAFDRIDILVNIPRATLPGAFAELAGADLAEALNLNVTASLLLAQAVARRMLEQAEDGDPAEAGAILNVSSIASRRTVPELLAYSVSCAALDQLTRSMAADLAPSRIRVNGIALGAVMTERLRQALKERDNLRGELLSVTPLGRIGEAEEAAEVAHFLVSPRASFMTGQIVTVDGGRSILDPLASPVR
ncbi:MAG: SDR family oxidoreductase [Pseudomonadota bacterium]